MDKIIVQMIGNVCTKYSAYIDQFIENHEGRYSTYQRITKEKFHAKYYLGPHGIDVLEFETEEDFLFFTLTIN